MGHLAWTLCSSRVIARLKLPLHTDLGLDVFLMRIFFHLSFWKSQMCCMKMHPCLCLSSLLFLLLPLQVQKGSPCVSRAHLLFCTITRALLCNQTTQKSKGQSGEAEILGWGSDCVLSLISLMMFFFFFPSTFWGFTGGLTHGDRCLRWQEADRPSYMLSPWHAAETCRNEPLAMSHPVASVQGENVF